MSRPDMNKTKNKDIILVVDDSAVECQFIKELLGKQYIILTSNNGEEALLLARQELPDLILLDIQMPKIDGYEVCRRLKSQEETKPIPVIFRTILDADEDETYGLSLGAADFVKKSSTPAILKKRISNQLKLKKEYIRQKSLNQQLHQEIEDRKKIEKQKQLLETKINEIQKLKSLATMAGGIAHSYNNLLTPIMGYTDLVLLESSPDSRIYDYVTLIRQATSRAAKLTEQVLLFSPGGNFFAEKTILSELINGMDEIAKSIIPKKITLNYSFKDNLPPVKVDNRQIQQALTNLIINAAEATGDRSGTITCSTGIQDVTKEYLEKSLSKDNKGEGLYSFIEISDSGGGIDGKEKNKIFEPFYTTKFQGRGLGLSTVLGIVFRHKGIVRLINTPGKGTSVKLLFPVIEEEHLLNKTGIKDLDSPELPAARRDKTKVILFIEDEAAVRNFAKTILTDSGFEVFTAEDGLEGVDIFEKNMDQIDLVITDIAMPKLNGTETFIRIRQISRDIPIIFNSGYAEKQMAAQISKLNHNGYIQKPYSISTLLKQVNSILKRHKS
jgi:CheY-like chemotaxis protein